MKKLTTADVIKKFRNVHGSKYDYSNVQYNGTHKKVNIKCLTHGEFFQTSLNHFQGFGCPKCKFDNLIQRQTKTTEEFINEAKQIHGDKYLYDCSNYIDGRLPIDIRCHKHGIFTQRPNNHIQRKSGCPKCAIEKHICSQTSTTDDFIEKSKLVHDNKYDYSKSNYLNYSSEIKIVCPRHGIFKQVAGTHMEGHGCPKCGHYISNGENTFLNYLKIPTKSRNIYIKPYKIDGYDPVTNTIYEFLGDYWHGNLEKFNSSDYNKMCKVKFGDLYSKTFKRLHILKNKGYNINYIWENDWKKFRNGIDKIPKIQIL
jgi:hypothetical protein